MTEQGWEPIYYHGLHELWNIVGGPQKLINFLLKFCLYLTMSKSDRLLLTYCLRVRLSWNFVLTRCCVLTEL